MAALLPNRSSVLPSASPSRRSLSIALPRYSKLQHGALRSAGSKAARVSLVCRASVDPSGATPKRHAVLHDFCMCIPYGAVSVTGGIALFFLNFTNIAGTAVVAGATSVAASVLSLKEWRTGGDTKLYTLTSAACASLVAYTAGSALSTLSGAPYWLSLLLTALSVAAAGFCIYNVAAGGNPPPKKGGDAAQP